MKTYQDLPNLSWHAQPDLHIYRIDKNIRPWEWEITRIDRPYIVFWFILEGEKEIKINDIDYIVKEGDLVIFPSQVPFEIIRSKSLIPFSHLEIAIEVRIGPFDLMNLYKFPIITKQDNLEQFERVIKLWDNLFEKWKNFRDISFQSEYLVTDFSLSKSIELLQIHSHVLEWLSELLLLLKPQTINLFPVLDSRFQQLFYYINNNLSHKLNLKALAEEIYLSQSHLNFLFKKKLSMTPMQYVRKVRMQKARELLLSSSLSLKEIAENIGFEEQSQFSRTFRRSVGLSPTEYRNKRDFI